MSYLAFFVGTLIPTAIASRLILIATRGWNGGMRRLVLAHVVSLLICGLFGGMGMADGGAFAGGQALIQYAPAQALWFLVDIYREKRAARQKQTAEAQGRPMGTDDYD
jgi:hypothetical protein